MNCSATPRLLKARLQCYLPKMLTVSNIFASQSAALLKHLEIGFMQSQPTGRLTLKELIGFGFHILQLTSVNPSSRHNNSWCHCRCHCHSWKCGIRIEVCTDEAIWVLHGVDLLHKPFSFALMGLGKSSHKKHLLRQVRLQSCR